tara:strand:+ start:60 stop:209 length:150 start_codon:yes stop_codon:yes gene_type:complete
MNSLNSITKSENKMEEELTSDCCGAFTTHTEMGICPQCLEHCEFTTGEE